jgi:FlaA1/EpsC-like NDP-sugar epimerase
MLGITLYTILWFLIVLSSGVVIKPYDFLIINWLLTVFFAGGMRFLARAILNSSSSESKNVIIYGAGYAGARLESAIRNDREIRVLGFVDDADDKQGLYFKGLRIFNPNEIEELINQKNIDEILIAIPSLTKSRLRDLISSLNKYPVVLRTIPDIAQFLSGEILVSDLKRIRIDDLLRREIRSPNNKLLKQDIQNKSVLVTGAGGSIGSELSRQILKQNPKLLILLDISEYALYLIERELVEKDSTLNLIALLCDVSNREKIYSIIKKYEVDTVFHAAAYKHVPLVEKNISAGVYCNIFGTLSCIDAALSGNVESFVFISTDKAVRPANIMGATKRFAELILQSKAKKEALDNKNRTRISMVRFGNVLGSSGSVVPLFNKQIESGGPITVTDPQMIRYFMTITEASQLVIQAGALGSLGDIFILDMGEPVRIFDLAKDMIRLSGMTLIDESNPDGDIEIIFTGKRQGEKLFEELVIGNDLIDTEHKSIMKANEEMLDWDLINHYLSELEKGVLTEDLSKIKAILSETVSGYLPTA